MRVQFEIQPICQQTTYKNDLLPLSQKSAQNRKKCKHHRATSLCLVICTQFQRHTQRARQTIVVVTASPPLIALYRASQASPQSAFEIGLGWKQERKLAGENEGMGRQKAWSHWFQYTARPKKTEAWKGDRPLGRATALRSLLDLLTSFLPLEPVWYTHTCLYSGKAYIKARLPVGLWHTTIGIEGFAVVEMQYSSRCCDLLQSGTVSLLITTMTRSTCFIKASFFTSRLKQMG